MLLISHHKEVKMANQSKRPTYSKNSRMKHYDLIFDEDVKQMRVTFYNHGAVDYITQDNQDEYYTITKGMEYRLDLISLKFYGTAAYDWFIAQFNNIEDPIRDVLAGKKIIIPHRSKLGSI